MPLTAGTLELAAEELKTDVGDREKTGKSQILIWSLSQRCLETDQVALPVLYSPADHLSLCSFFLLISILLD